VTVTDPGSWQIDEWGGRSIADVLTDEHDRLETLLADVISPATPIGEPGSAEYSAQRRKVADAFIASLSRHLSAEEQELFPAARTALPGGAQLIDGEIAGDKEILRTLTGLHAAHANSPEFDALLAQTQEQLRRHTQIAAIRIFPGIRQRLSREEQIRLGNRIDIFEETAPTRPHPNTPSTPPLNKIVDSAIGTLDKVRDALSGRKTRPEDL
jgi:hemerythrin-like domain-containing protein